MKREPGFIQIVLKFLLVLSALLLSWIAAYYLTSVGYSFIAWEPHDLIVFLINAVVGFVLFGSGISLIAPFLKQREHVLFTEILDVLKRISRGDFRVKLDLGAGTGKGRQRRPNPFAALADSINDMAANLKAMEEMRQEFVSNVSHEIGSPLTTISGFARALQEENLDRELRQRYLTIIEMECARLSKLSDNLLKLAVLDSDQRSFHLNQYRLDKQLVKLILACEPLWDAKNIDISADLDEVEIHADEDLLSQVWINLIHNAIKFTPESGKIHVQLKKNGGEAEVSVIDNGPGIAEQEHSRIFERFYKADKSRNRNIGGSGLGLSIAHKIIGMHGGSISVSSKIGEGAEFTVTLPLTGVQGSYYAVGSNV